MPVQNQIHVLISYPMIYPLGIMRTEDLKVLFKNAAFKPEDIKTYIIDLLNKFEVALLWDEYNLLIPSLLPREEDMMNGYHQANVLVCTYTVLYI